MGPSCSSLSLARSAWANRYAISCARHAGWVPSSECACTTSSGTRSSYVLLPSTLWPTASSLCFASTAGPPSLSQPLAIDASAIHRAYSKAPPAPEYVTTFGVRSILARTSADWIEFRVAGVARSRVFLSSLSFPSALLAISEPTRQMAAEPRLNDIQEQLVALFELVYDHPERREPYPKPTFYEGNRIKAVKNDWMKSFCCLNLVASHKFVGSVWQCLKQRLDSLKTALNDGRALRFDVLVLGIASHGVPALSWRPS